MAGARAEEKTAFQIDLNCKYMRISYKHNFIFIHVDRTGGTSISRALDPFSYKSSDMKRFYAALLRRLGFKESYKWKKYRTQHITAKELKENLPPNIWDRCFKFAIIRNPWDWLLSIYYARLQHPVHLEYELTKYLGSFERYAEWYAENRSLQQSQYLFDDTGNLLLDFVGRYEHIEQDYKKACNIIGIEAPLPHLNHAINKKNDYRLVYTDRLIALVGDILKDDVSLGYDFNSTLSVPLFREKFKSNITS